MKKVFFEPRTIRLGASILLAVLCVLFLPLYTCIPLHDLESIFKILAILAATLFFAYKLITGWLIINLNIKPTVERISKDRTTDHLMINLLLVKGSIDSLWLDYIELRVCEVLKNSETSNKIELKELCKLKPINVYRHLFKEEINAFANEPDEDRPLNIAPGEEVNFAAYTIVNKSAVISVEIFVTGTRPFYNFKSKYPGPIQWVSSVVVLPKVPTE